MASEPLRAPSGASSAAKSAAATTSVPTSDTTVDLSGCDLSGAELTGARLPGVKLVATMLRGVKLGGALLAGADLSDALRDFRVPLSITLPDSSPFITPSHGAEMRALVPNSRLRIVPHAKHALPFSHARSEAEHLVAFLTEIES